MPEAHPLIGEELSPELERMFGSSTLSRRISITVAHYEAEGWRLAHVAVEPHVFEGRTTMTNHHLYFEAAERGVELAPPVFNTTFPDLPLADLY